MVGLACLFLTIIYIGAIFVRKKFVFAFTSVFKINSDREGKDQMPYMLRWLAMQGVWNAARGNLPFLKNYRDGSGSGRDRQWKKGQQEDNTGIGRNIEGQPPISVSPEGKQPSESSTIPEAARDNTIIEEGMPPETNGYYQPRGNVPKEEPFPNKSVEPSGEGRDTGLSTENKPGPTQITPDTEDGYYLVGRNRNVNVWVRPPKGQTFRYQPEPSQNENSGGSPEHRGAQSRDDINKIQGNVSPQPQAQPHSQAQQTNTPQLNAERVPAKTQEVRDDERRGQEQDVNTRPQRESETSEISETRPDAAGNEGRPPSGEG